MQIWQNFEVHHFRRHRFKHFNVFEVSNRKQSKIEAAGIKLTSKIMDAVPEILKESKPGIDSLLAVCSRSKLLPYAQCIGSVLPNDGCYTNIEALLTTVAISVWHSTTQEKMALKNPQTHVALIRLIDFLTF